jgi:hypothetical protein
MSHIVDWSNNINASLNYAMNNSKASLSVSFLEVDIFD